MSDFRSPTYPGSAETPPTTPVVSPKKKSGNLTNLLLIGAAFIAIGGIAFAGGRATAPAAAATGFPNGFTPPTGSFAPGALPGGGGALGGGNASLTISGTVKSIDGTTMTITTANGTETVVDTSSSTFHSQAAASATDVQAGSTVQVAITGLGGFRPGANGAAPSSAPGAGTGSTPIQATDVTLTSGQ